MKVAKVAVDNINTALDREYDYRIPDELCDKIETGCRVVVPFGRGDKPKEGIVVALSDDSEYVSLKSIAKLVDSEPLLSAEMCALARHMREKIFCTYFDAFHTMLPLAMRISMKEVYTPAPAAAEKMDGLKEDCRQMLRGILTAKKADVEKLTDCFGGETQRLLAELLNGGLVEKSLETPQRTDDAYVKSIQLIVSTEEAEVFAASKKNNRVKYEKVIDILSGRDPVPLNEVCYLAGVTRSVPDTMCKYGITELVDIEYYRKPYAQKLDKSDCSAIELNAEQQSAFSGLTNLYDSPKAETALLFGVTGSGKTNVYMRLIDYATERGGNVIVLVPEISLTPQLTDKFYARYGCKVAVLHSGLSVGERYDEWKRVKKGEASIVIGTRSAVFAPFDKVGLIVMDEEQETTYKSESSPRYHARDIAKFRARYHGALLLLASATPSVDTFSLAEAGKIARFTLANRYSGQELPEIMIADLTKELKNGNPGTISTPLKREIEKNLAAGEQTILFLNRRGYHTYIGCPSCGFVMTCPNCSVSYTYHSKNNLLMCHYCGSTAEAETVCPSCRNGRLRYLGAGTQKVEDEIKTLFPGVRTLRMDLDTTNYKLSHEKILEAFSNGEADILIGTQMVTKGLDMALVTLVGVLLADSMLFSDDYRAGERTFSLLTQVVGRAGRADKHGRAVIQTYHPESEVLQLAKTQDYQSFFKDEILFRRTMIFPPYCDIFTLTISGEEEERVRQAAEETGCVLSGVFREQKMKNIIMYNPTPSAQLKLNNRYRYRILIKGRRSAQMSTIFADLRRSFGADKKNKDFTLAIDINPMTIA